MAEQILTRPSLLLRLRGKRDDEAWRQFDAAYSDLIVRYARRRGLQLADAEEIRQTVLEKLTRSLPDFEYDPRKGRFRDYLRLCSRNAIFSFLSRHTSRLPTVSMDEGALSGVHEPDNDWDQEWMQQHFRRALQAIRATTDDRTLAVFHDLLKGTDVAATGSRFGLTEANVRKIKQRIRERLEQKIREQLADEEAHDILPATQPRHDSTI